MSPTPLYHVSDSALDHVSHVQFPLDHVSYTRQAISEMGKSKPWPEALEKLTGSKTLDVGALTAYFEPLRKWMVDQRNTLGYAAPGWDEDDDLTTTVKPTHTTTVVAGVSTLAPVLFNTIASLLFALVVFFR
ncbi:hypothetical protein ACROYT_G029126 [Oculina patagonica]